MEEGKAFLSNLKRDHTAEELEQIHDLAHFGAFVAVAERAGTKRIAQCSEEKISEMVGKVIPELTAAAENFFEQLKQYNKYRE
jgi:hypothetical protein